MILERGPYISYANCGLPYHVGGVITDRDELLLQTPELMKERFNIDVRVRHEALSIDRERKLVRVKALDEGRAYDEPYDILVLATGSSPVKPPIPGIDSPRVKTLWTLPDTDELRAFIKEKQVKRAAVIGGGFIGIEMAENLRRLGLEVSLVEMLDQVMAPLDYEMALLLHEELKQHGVQLHLKDGVKAFHDQGEQVQIALNSGDTLDAELVILAIGVRPNGELAKAAGLPVNQRGGIKVNQRMRTEDPSIYAVGDAVEVTDLALGGLTMIPLAGPANKQGRIAANNIAGLNSQYEGSLGTAVVQVFGLTAAGTGANEKALIRQGMQIGEDYQRVIISQNSHAGYYPGATRMTLKLLFSLKDERILGAQIVGVDGVDKRIDSIAVAMRLKAPVRALMELELSYAPPYSSAKDPVNMLGFMAANLLDGFSAFAPWDSVEKEEGLQLLDVRDLYEQEYYRVPGATVIPLGELRQRMQELDKAKPTLVFCAVGVRAHNAARLLKQSGFADVRIYPGGALYYSQTHPEHGQYC